MIDAVLKQKHIEIVKINFTSFYTSKITEEIVYYQYLSCEMSTFAFSPSFVNVYMRYMFTSLFLLNNRFAVLLQMCKFSCIH